ncbi:recombinase [Mesorhizobium loti]|nr:recombinase [Mesorhizobium loti]
MTSTDLIPTALLKRKAVVYVRQSTQSQVMTNLESQRRQYDLVDIARQRGFADIEVIDDDLGRSASGTVARPGFDRLVAWLCAGKIGAVLCLDASRLARNGRDWHHLLELCGLVEARVIDHDGVYNPCLPNDRLLLGMKGSISEFELGVLKARMLEAARSKARRGELRLSVPFGYIWHREAGLGLDPDIRLQEVIRFIFARFRELGSARQVLLSMIADQIRLRDLETRQPTGRPPAIEVDPSAFANMAENLSAAWNGPDVTMRARQQLLRTLIADIIVDVDDAVRDVVLMIHWRGGQHSELRVRKPRAGEHGCATTEDALAVMRIGRSLV